MQENGTLYSTQLFEVAEGRRASGRRCTSKRKREARSRNPLWKIRDARGHELERLRLEMRWLEEEEIEQGKTKRVSEASVPARLALPDCI